MNKTVVDSILGLTNAHCGQQFAISGQEGGGPQTSSVQRPLGEI